MKRYILILSAFIWTTIEGQQLKTRFEKTNGTESATYFETIDFYNRLDKVSNKIKVNTTTNLTDAGYPLHWISISADGKLSPQQWHNNNKIVILINNGIHAGEPDGIDASMMLVRDVAIEKVILPKNVCLVIIPVYNIGGCLNRNSNTRVNQAGPIEYGFRGNSQYLDLNRDFTKSDSRESKLFAQLFHFIDPDIFIDNHVSDGADYQHIITMLTTQYDKLGKPLGEYVKEKFEPAVYASMHQKGWDMCPYVNFDTTDITLGMEQFYDPPRFASGYAALWQCMSFVIETHMLKPFKERVTGTYEVMKSIIEEASKQSEKIIDVKRKSIEQTIAQKSFPLNWIVDRNQFSYINFKGYEQAFKTSEVTGFKRLYYDHNKPFTKQINFFNVFTPQDFFESPDYYIIPQGWHSVIDLLKLNNVQMNRLSKDTMIYVEGYKIVDYKTSTKAYEKHYRHYDVKANTIYGSLKFLKGDYIIPTQQRAKRFLAEMLEPTGNDSYFSWNFFDAILQQKEGYSDYRWEDIAAEILKNNPFLKHLLNEKKQMDSSFSVNASAQLYWIYTHSLYYEPGHLQYPVYKIKYLKTNSSVK